jgi:Domain of unknown function (DUF4124)
MHLLGYLTVVALMYCATASAEIYRWKDEEGNVIYSDTPQPGAEIVELSEPTIVPGQPVPSAADATSGKAEKLQAKPYESVTITRPTDEQTFWDNVANIGVTINLRPALQAGFGHKLQLLFDGQAVGKPGSGRSFTLPGVERGAHTLQAVILDTDGQVFARSPITTFFVHKQMIRRQTR